MTARFLGAKPRIRYSAIAPEPVVEDQRHGRGNVTEAAIWGIETACQRPAPIIGIGIDVSSGQTDTFAF